MEHAAIGQNRPDDDTVYDNDEDNDDFQLISISLHLFIGGFLGTPCIYE